MGSKKNPIWRVVVADQRSPRDGRFIETIGQYNPQTDPSTIRIDEERLQHWLARGAQPSNTVKKLMKARRKSGGPTAGGRARRGREPAEAPEAEADAPARPRPSPAPRLRRTPMRRRMPEAPADSGGDEPAEPEPAGRCSATRGEDEPSS